MKVIIGVLILAIVLLVGVPLYNRTTNVQSIPAPSPTLPSEKVNIKASFTVVTGSITRSFKAEKYHNLSPDVYIEASNPTIARVTKTGITWDDFFKTLPMKLTKECLVTGDGETFCDKKDGSLQFFLNDNEDINLLDKEIKEDDKALIRFIFKKRE